MDDRLAQIVDIYNQIQHTNGMQKNNISGAKVQLKLFLVENQE